MEEMKKQQMEVLQMGAEYVQKLIPAIKEIVPELRGDLKEDTKAYLDQIIEGINFVIEIVNATMPLINEKETILNKDGIEEKVQDLSKALASGQDALVADALEQGMIPFLDIYYQVASIMLK